MGGASLSRRSGPRKEFLVIGSPLLHAAECLDEAPTGTLVVSRQSFDLISDHFSSEVTERGNARIRYRARVTLYPFMRIDLHKWYYCASIALDFPLFPLLHTVNSMHKAMSLDPKPRTVSAQDVPSYGTCIAAPAPPPEAHRLQRVDQHKAVLSRGGT